ncbi:MAG: thymidine phosphorylase, partial [Hyphomonas sp.]|nr:thymidine phosphorylase [Hyphomonas sp.]
MKDSAPNLLQARRLGVITRHEAVAFVRADCPVCHSEGVSAHSQVTLIHGNRSVVATLFQVTSDW